MRARVPCSWSLLRAVGRKVLKDGEKAERIMSEAYVGIVLAKEVYSNILANQKHRSASRWFGVDRSRLHSEWHVLVLLDEISHTHCLSLPGLPSPGAPTVGNDSLPFWHFPGQEQVTQTRYSRQRSRRMGAGTPEESSSESERSDSRAPLCLVELCTRSLMWASNN